MSYLQQSAIKRGLFIIVYCVLHCFLGVPSFAEGQEQYFLITNEYLQESFQLLVDHRCSQGMDGKLITVEDINDNNLYGGKDIQERIRSCIQSYYDPNRTMYLVLGGDESVVPPRYCETHGPGYYAPVDLYYADMDGTRWDGDGDGIYGESEDVGLAELTPELCFGRIPVHTPEDAQAYYSKVLRYESYVDSNEFVDSLLLLTGSGYDACFEGPTRPAGYRDHDPVSAQEIAMTDTFINIIQPYRRPGYLARFFDTNTDWDVDRFGDFQQTTENVIDVLSKDFHYIYYWQHSNAATWGFPDEDSVAAFKPGHASQLTNTLPSIVFARGCGTGYYDAEIFDVTLNEALIKNPNGGPVVMFAHARSTGGSPHWDQILRNVFQESHHRIGEAYRACLSTLAPLAHKGHQYIFLLLGDPAISCHRQTKKTLQLFSPKGNEVIEFGSDLFVRWNAAGTFSSQETVYLEYSEDDGQNWCAIPEANALPYDDGLFTWSNCPLISGTNYRVRVSSTSEPLLYNDISAKSFTIANMGKLTVKSSPCLKVRIDGTYSNQTDYTCFAILNSNYQLIAPQKKDTVWKSDVFRKKDFFEFAGWVDANGVLLSDSNDLQFVFDHDTTITALYNYVGQGRTYYVNDEISEDGIAPGNNDNDGLSPDTPMASIQALLGRYPKIGYEDIVYISDGRYYENIFMSSVHTGVTLQGAGMDRTVIDGRQTESCLIADFGIICHLSHLGFENGNGNGHGGALQLGSGEVTCTIRNCRFEDNVASEKGGAIYLAGSAAFLGLEVYDSVFIRNHGTKGGVMFTAQDARAQFHDCVFLENTSNGSGAFRIAVSGSVDFVDCVFEGNVSSGVGGAIDTFSPQTSTAIRCLFKNNEAIEGGGAICIGGSSSMTLEDCVFEHNSSSSGGAIQIIGDGFSQIRRSTFQGNSANIGGAIEIEENSTSECDDCIFENNSSSSGGAIQIIGQAFNQIKHSTFQGNSATIGGAIEIGENSTSKVKDCTFENNDSSKGSGAIHTLGSSTANLWRSIIKNNTGFKGGGLYVGEQANVSANHCLFVDNVATKAGGAIGIYLQGAFSASHCTITDNNCDNVSGGVAWHSSGDLTLVNSIIFYNPSPSCADLRLSGNGTASVTYCCSPVQCEGVGNITNVPLFLDRDGNDYRLANDSPCIDAGSPETADFVDLDGIIGPVDGNYDGSVVADIGAYEFSSSH